MAEPNARHKVLVIHGPNLNMLGKREPEIYGHQTLDEINAGLKAKADKLGLHIETFQSNHEGDIVEKNPASTRQISWDSYQSGSVYAYQYCHPGFPVAAKYPGYRDTPFQHLPERSLPAYINDVRCRSGSDFRIRIPWVSVGLGRFG